MAFRAEEKEWVFYFTVCGDIEIDLDMRFLSAPNQE